MSETREKKVFVCSFDCPFCQNQVHMFKSVKVLKEAVKAEKLESYVVEKGRQTKLVTEAKQ